MVCVNKCPVFVYLQLTWAAPCQRIIYLAGGVSWCCRLVGPLVHIVLPKISPHCAHYLTPARVSMSLHQAHMYKLLKWCMYTIEQATKTRCERFLYKCRFKAKDYAVKIREVTTNNVGWSNVMYGSRVILQSLYWHRCSVVGNVVTYNIIKS